MKRTILLVVSIVLFCLAFALAEEANFDCSYFSLTLPEGIVPLEDSASYSAAAAMDYGENIETLLVASDPAQITLITATAIASDESADLAASNASEVLLGSNSTVVEKNCGNNTCSAFSCSIESVNYSFYYLSDGKHVYCLTFVGLTPEEEQNVISSISLKL